MYHHNDTEHNVKWIEQYIEHYVLDGFLIKAVLNGTCHKLQTRSGPMVFLPMWEYYIHLKHLLVALLLMSEQGCDSKGLSIARTLHSVQVMLSRLQPLYKTHLKAMHKSLYHKPNQHSHLHGYNHYDIPCKLIACLHLLSQHVLYGFPL
jgi:hypothetical protein